jgi:O-antigen/teichoic acid export membrane protein
VGESVLVPFLLVGTVYVASRSFSSFFSAVFQGYNRVTWSAALSSITGVARLVAVVGLILLGYGAVGAFLGYALSFAVATVAGAIALYAGYYVHHDPTEEPERGLSRRLLEYSVPLTATRGANVLDKKMDTVLVGLLLNMSAVSFYTVAKQISDFVALPAASFGYTISPTLGEQKAGDRIDQASRIYEESLKYVVVAYIPAMVGLILVAKPTIQLIFGADYLGAVPVVQVFSGFMLVNAINKVTSDGLDYLGRARSRAVVKSFTAVSNFLLNLLLIPLLGVVGAAAATVITYSVYTGTNVYIIHSELDIRLGRIGRVLASTGVVTAGMTAVVIFARPYISDIISLFAVVALGGGVWAVLLILIGLVNPRELANVVT